MIATTSALSVAGRHWIAGEWREPVNGTFESRNPAHWDKVVGRFPNATAKEVAEAVSAARTAFPSWRRTSRIRRAELFDQLVNALCDLVGAKF